MNWKHYGGWGVAGVMTLIAAFLGGILYGQLQVGGRREVNPLLRAMPQPLAESPDMSPAQVAVGVAELREAAPVTPLKVTAFEPYAASATADHSNPDSPKER